MTQFITLLIAGLVSGAVYAVSASGLVVTYNATGIFNFAHGACGMVMAYLFWQLWQGWGVPEVLSIVIVLLVAAPIAGLLVERLVMRPLYGASTSVSLVVTCGLLLLLVGVATSLWKPSQPYVIPEYFVGKTVDLGQVTVTYTQILTLVVAVAVAIFLRLLFRRTRTGIAMRAVVDDPNLAELSGAAANRIAGYAWMIGIMLAGLAGILLAPTTMDVTTLTELVIYGYAAAIVGRLRSLPLTFLGAMILGVANSMAIGYVPSDQLTLVTQILPMSMLLIVLLTMPEARLATGRLARTRPPRAPSLSMTLIASVALVVVTALAIQHIEGANLLSWGNALALAFPALGLVLLTGYSGQVSLCQFALFGLGAFVAHWIGEGGNLLSLLAAFGICAGAGIVICLPTLRLRGLYLALSTLAVAVLMDQVFFTSDQIIGAGGLATLKRPSLFGWHLVNDRTYIVAIGVLLAIALVVVGTIRRSAYGRRLVALDDSPAACSTIGMNSVPPRVIVFGLAAGLAGLGGALYGAVSGTVGGVQFTFLQSVALFVLVVMNGRHLLTSAVTGGFALAYLPVVGSHVPHLYNFAYLLFGLGVIAVGRNPDGMGRTYREIRELWDRRRGRAVPAVVPEQLDDAVARSEVSTVG